MRVFLLLRSPMLASSQPTPWSNVIPDMASTWLAVCCTVVMLSPRMSTPPLPPSRPREAFSSWIGVPPDLRLESTTSLLLLSLEETLLKYRELSACCPTPQPLPKLGQDLTISSPRQGRTWL